MSLIDDILIEICEVTKVFMTNYTRSWKPEMSTLNGQILGGTMK